MCELCQHHPCITRCPNYEEKPVCCCDICGEDIFAGDVYYEIKVEGFVTQNICEDCIEDSKCYAEHEEPDPDCWELTDRLYEESKYEDDEG